MNRTATKFKQLLEVYLSGREIDIREEHSRDRIYVDGSEITNLSFGSLDFWAEEQKMNDGDLIDYLESNILSGVLEKINENK